MDKLKMHTPDFTDENIARLAELFPSCVTETKDAEGNLNRAIDFDQLRQELSGNIVDGPHERYHLDWPGKREALLTANAPIAKTLRPSREESVDFDTTKNLYIEGDNLDALKLLQETYLGKVKMIYIDPPYNTGNDFIYEDDFAEDKDAYFERSMQKDEEGNRLVWNSEANGRFHSDWLSMLYPRLKLARNLLRDDGVIFVSIDDNEVLNLLGILNEIFGSANHIATVVWEKVYTTKNDAKYFSASHEYLTCYSKNTDGTMIGRLGRTEEMDARYKNIDNDPRGPWKAIPLYSEGESKNGRYDIVAPGGAIFQPRKDMHWRYREADMMALIDDNRIYFGKDENSQPNLKRFLNEVAQGVRAKTLWPSKDVGSNDSAKKELKELFGSDIPFPYPKPVTYIQRMIQLGGEVESNEELIILDFFSGSATSAHAAMKQNAGDGGNRKMISVQWPEETERGDFSTIAEIGKERIRRAGKKIKEEAGLMAANLDIGFRVLKVDTSNMKDVYYSPDTAEQAKLTDLITNIKEDRTPEDLLFQVLLDWGVDLALPIERETIAGKKVFFVDDNAFAACFDDGISAELVKAIAERKPMRAVFKDNGYDRDDTKINVAEIFKLISPDTELKAI